MLALCERDQKDHLQRVLENVDITEVHSSDLLGKIIGYLGRYSLDSVARKFLLELRESGKSKADSLYRNMFMYLANHCL